MPVPRTVFSPTVSDDGALAMFISGRGLLVTPDPFIDEVLLALTGLAPEPGGKPVLSNRSPGTVPAGSAELLLSISGSGFVPGASVLWKPSSTPVEQRDAIFIAPTKLQLRLPATELATAGVFTFKVLNPGGSSSTGQLSFRVN
jgi:hypothetical protein